MWHPNPIFSEPYVGLLMFSTDDKNMPRVTVAMKPKTLRHIISACESVPTHELKLPEHIDLNELLIDGENMEAPGWPEEWDRDKALRDLDRIGRKFKNGG